jgi:type III restriction enzyme
MAAHGSIPISWGSSPMGAYSWSNYKGALLAGAGVDDTNEKRTIGRLWESRSSRKCLFIVVEKEIDGRDMRAQMVDKIS